MENIPTIEEILVKNEVFKKPEISNFNLVLHRDCYITDQENIKKSMIEFAKLHVQAALKEASEKARTKNEWSGNTGSEYCDTIVDINSILNAYPLTNIK